MFDISSLKAKETEKYVFVDKYGNAYTDDKGNELFAVMHGPTSKVVQTLRDNLYKKAQARLKSHKKEQTDLKKSKQENRDFLRKCTESLSFAVDGKAGDEAIEAFFSNTDYDLLVSQLDRFMADDGNFMPLA